MFYQSVSVSYLGRVKASDGEVSAPHTVPRSESADSPPGRTFLPLGASEAASSRPRPVLFHRPLPCPRWLPARGLCRGTFGDTPPPELQGTHGPSRPVPPASEALLQDTRPRHSRVTGRLSHQRRHLSRLSFPWDRCFQNVSPLKGTGEEARIQREEARSASVFTETGIIN